MTAATFRAEVVGDVCDLASSQWARLGVSMANPAYPETRAADPEALILFTLEVGRADPRLFDETLDWLLTNEQLISVQRLRNLCANATDKALVESALTWVARSRPRARLASRATVDPHDELEPLFRGIAEPLSNTDPAFARHGLSRAYLTPSGKSQHPALAEPIAFALRLRRLLGVGVRAEVLRTLLTVRAPRLSGRVISTSAGFAARNVRDGLTQLREAGVVDVIDVGGDRHYAASPNGWAALLGIEPADLPHHYDWIPALRALTAVLRWLHQPSIDDLSDYLRASQARALIAEIEGDLRYAGVTPSTAPAHGADYWHVFEETIRSAIRHARALP